MKINGIEIGIDDKVRVETDYGRVYFLELTSNPTRCAVIWHDPNATEILLTGRRLKKNGYPDSRCNSRLPVIAKPEQITKL